MLKRSMLKIAASLLAIVGACTTDDYVTVPYYYDTYLWPVVDYGYTDTALWYDGYYDPYIGYNALTVAPPGADGDGGDGGAHARLPRPLRGLFAAWRVVLKADCVPAVPWIDNDEDGVPASYGATFNCIDQTVGDRQSSVTGTVAIVDADDSTAPSGLRIMFTDFTVVTSGAGNRRTRTMNGTATLTPLEGGAFQTSTDLAIVFDFSDAGYAQTQGTFSQKGEGTYLPDAAAGSDVFAEGTVTLSGTSTLSRTFGSGSSTRTVTRRTDPVLHWNRACRTENADSSGFDSGSLVYQDDQGGKLRLQFNGCGNPTVTAGG